MSIADRLSQEQSKREQNLTRELFAGLIQTDQYVGEVFSLGYEYALVQIHDHHRQKVGGIPSLSFLIATRVDPTAETDFRSEDASVILLRVLDAAPLPNDQEANRIRVESAQRVSGEVGKHWEEQGVMDATTAHLLSFAGIKCRIIGTFYVDTNPKAVSEPDRPLVLRFGSDLSNYYPNRGLKVFKPRGDALGLIVNYRDPEQASSSSVLEIGHVRYASTNRSFQGVDIVGVNLNPEDLKAQKTALFGMTRTGKSNTTKIILQSVFNLRFDQATPARVGQLVFDPDGEYANENAQDGDHLNPNCLKNVWRSNDEGRQEDVVTYGLSPHPRDPGRRLMLLNFHLDQNLQTGKEIINSYFEGDGRTYIQNFCQVSFRAPERDNFDSEGEFRSAQTRFNRRVLAYRALLHMAGFRTPSSLLPMTRGLFSAGRRGILDALARSAKPDPSSHKYAARILNVSLTPNPSWDQVATALISLYEFVEEADKQNSIWGFRTFNQEYMETSNTGEPWADEDLKKILKMLSMANGPRLVGRAAAQHTHTTDVDYSDEIWDHVSNGRLVIVDQSTGDPVLNQSSADRIMWKIFQQSRALFRDGQVPPDVLIYIEEAHNVLPSSKEDDLQNVWVRTAKEGAKYRIGMVYATQEVSSIQRNILKNTANWFIGHLNNTDETQELTKYYDFADFEPSIRRAQDKGFVRVKTLSNLFVIPVQINRFRV